MVTYNTPNSRAVTRTLQYVTANKTIQEVQRAATNGTKLESTFPNRVLCLDQIFCYTAEAFLFVNKPRLRCD